MTTTNPYRFTTPVEAEMFFGRQEEINTLIKHLTDVPGESVALIGGRRIGKTSLLRRLLRTLETPQNESPPSLLRLPILLDLYGENIESVPTFFQTVVNSAQRKLNNVLITALADTSFITKGQPLSPRVFQSVMIEWEQIVIAQWGCRLRLILLLDECEQIIEQPWTPALYSGLRALLQDQTTGSLLKIVLAGSHRSLTQVHQRGSPLGNVLANPVMLNVLDEQITHTLINRPTAGILSNEIIQIVTKQSGGTIVDPFVKTTNREK